MLTSAKHVIVFHDNILGMRVTNDTDLIGQIQALPLRIGCGL